MNTVRSHITRKLRSLEDSSVNFIIKHGSSDMGNLEARFVQRNPDYFSAYVSSHNGCKMGCKMCYLTQLNQTWFNHANIADYYRQFSTVMKYYDLHGDGKAKRVNVNFMARGEPLANKVVVNKYSSLYNLFENRALHSGLNLKMNISTIMPNAFRGKRIVNTLSGNSHLYYSLYSVNPDFRKKWLPNSMPFEYALENIQEYQEHSKLPITLHWAFIKGENDNLEDIHKLVNHVKTYNLYGKFNLVRYNPPPNLKHTTEPSENELKKLLNLVSTALEKNDNSKIVSRVGKDVYASCGTFITDQE